MRVEGKEIKTIYEWLITMDCKRLIPDKKTKKTREWEIQLSTLYRLFKDPVYFGQLNQAEREIDLCAIYAFEPMITEDEYHQIQALTKRKVKHYTKQLLPCRGGIVITPEGKPYAPEIGMSSTKEGFLYLVIKKLFFSSGTTP